MVWLGPLDLTDFPGAEGTFVIDGVTYAVPLNTTDDAVFAAWLRDGSTRTLEEFCAAPGPMAVTSMSATMMSATVTTNYGLYVLPYQFQVTETPVQMVELPLAGGTITDAHALCPAPLRPEGPPAEVCRQSDTLRVRCACVGVSAIA